MKADYTARASKTRGGQKVGGVRRESAGQGMSMSEDEFQAAQVRQRRSKSCAGPLEGVQERVLRAHTRQAKEKRKSEVLIAAQSLDYELQNVKNLKRISIGSMDLLMDPEMEFRMNGAAVSPSASPRNSLTEESLEWFQLSAEQEQGGELPLHAESIDAHSSAGGSSDTARDELLTSASSVVPSEELSCSHPLSPPAAAKKSTLMSSRSKLGRQHTDTTHTKQATGEPFSSNLLWVRADQHPNVKPENYLELVHDTLNNLRIGARHGRGDSPVQQSNTPVANGESSTASARSLVRKQSRLRKSFTEVEAIEESQFTDSIGSEIPVGKRMRVSSLKEITEELTRISNNAGLTDSDAITLARTLGIGSQSADEHATFSECVPSAEAEENEYASSILAKNGLAIPARSSLRRSKFTTYRIRSAGSDNSPPENKSTSSSSLAAAYERNSRSPKMQKAAFKGSHPRLSGENTSLAPQSPNSINDIYDHYNTSDTDDGSPELQGSPVTHTSDASFTSSPNIASGEHCARNAHKISPISVSQLSATSSSSTSPGSSKSAESTKSWTFDQKSPLRSITLNSSTKGHKISAEKKKGWSWFGNSRRPSSESVLLPGTDSEGCPMDESQPIQSEEYPLKHPISPVSDETPRRGNHSRNRHQTSSPEELEIGWTETSLTTLDGDTEQDGKPQHPKTKEKLEKKFMKIFKKRSGTGLSQDTPNQGEESSLKATSRIRRSRESKRQTDEPSASLTTSVSLNNHNNGRKSVSISRPTWQRTESSYNGDKGKGSITSLQPAVSVTSSRDSHEQTRQDPQPQSLVTKMDGSSSNGVTVSSQRAGFSKKGRSKTSHSRSKLSTSHDIAPVDNRPSDVDQKSTEANNTLSSRAEDSHPSLDPGKSALGPGEIAHSLPPRKLRFDDVLRPEKPNSPMKFTPSAFGFPLPPLTVSTVIMFDHRLPIYVERAIYRLSHLKLSDPKRELRQQVLLSNFMYSYLNLVNHSLYLQQIEEDKNQGIQFESTDNMASSSGVVPEKW
ncbi:FAAL185Wp [Eremothecium gossypii FDAG1]|nr:FAAL185Wp [Eremothecium gossypii FDAG1]